MVAQVILAVLGSEAVLRFIQYLIDRYDRRKDTPERKILRALGADRLGDLLRAWKHSDVREAAEWEIIEEMYEGYIALGGNGEIRKLFDECRDVPTTE